MLNKPGAGRGPSLLSSADVVRSIQEGGGKIDKAAAVADKQGLELKARARVTDHEIKEVLDPASSSSPPPSDLVSKLRKRGVLAE